MDEANTRMRVITPLIQGLGWDIFGGDVQNEYEITYGSGRVRVDYALLIDGRPRIFVEAKSLNTVLSDDHASQAISYAKSRDVRWCVLTNGSELRIYNAAWGTEPRSTLLEIIRIDPDRDPPDRLRLLSRASVASGELDRLATKSRFSQRISAHLSRLLPDLKEEWVKEAGNKVFAAVRNELDKVTRKQVKDAVAPLLRIDLDGSEDKDNLSGPEVELQPPLARANLASLPDGLVVICPGRRDGVEWMKRYNAWGYKRIGRAPEYFALYVSEGVREIRYLAQIKAIVDPSHPDSPVRGRYEEEGFYKPGKKVIVFEEGSLTKLDPPIPIGSDTGKAPQNLRYCSLNDFRMARTLDDI